MCPHCALMGLLLSLPVIGAIISWWRIRKLKKD